MGEIQVLPRLYLFGLSQSEQHRLPRWRALDRPRHLRSAGLRDINAYTVPRILNTVWTGVRYAVWSNLDLAAGVYWESQNNFLAAPAVCTGSGIRNQQHPMRRRPVLRFIPDRLSAGPARQSLRRPFGVECLWGRREWLPAHPEHRPDRRPAVFGSEDRSAGISADAALVAIVRVAAEPVVVAVSGMGIRLEPNSRSRRDASGSTARRVVGWWRVWTGLARRLRRRRQKALPRRSR